MLPNIEHVTVSPLSFGAPPWVIWTWRIWPGSGLQPGLLSPLSAGGGTDDWAYRFVSRAEAIRYALTLDAPVSVRDHAWDKPRAI
jgi:hypothetical protein